MSLKFCLHLAGWYYYVNTDLHNKMCYILLLINNDTDNIF